MEYRLFYEDGTINTFTDVDKKLKFESKIAGGYKVTVLTNKDVASNDFVILKKVLKGKINSPISKLEVKYNANVVKTYTDIILSTYSDTAIANAETLTLNYKVD